MPLKRNTCIVLFIFLLFSLVIAGCSPSESKSDTSGLASLVNMPPEVQSAPVTVQQSYQFAVAHPDVLTQIPCYCGCGSMGHTSNYACYVAGKNEDGSVKFDDHALGCSICVDITQDTMRLMNDGKSVPEIRAYIDLTYAQYGPSNMP
jgi:Protein of unknown function with PCYCGC motif